MDFQDLDKPLSLDNFEKTNLLGRGGFAKVFQVRKKDGNDKDNIYAMKVLRKEKIVNNQIAIRHLVSERNILKSVRHNFVVEMIYAFQCQDKFYFILEFLSGGNLEQLLFAEKFFTEIQGRFYASEIILAIEYLHSKDIMYRDLKTDNILLDRNGHVKISDFGLSKDHLADDERTYTKCGTLTYAAPELLSKDGCGHGKEVDWWALGIVMYRMLMGQVPFENNDRSKLIKLIKNGSFNFVTPTSFDAQDLIRGFLTVNVEQRLGSSSVKEIKTHPFFEDICWDHVLNRMEKPPFVPKIQNGDFNLPDNPDIEVVDSTLLEFAINESQNELFKGFSFVNTKDIRSDGFANSFVYKDNFQRIIRRKLLKMCPKFIRNRFNIGNRRQQAHSIPSRSENVRTKCN